MAPPGGWREHRRRCLAHEGFAVVAVDTGAAVVAHGADLAVVDVRGGTAACTEVRSRSEVPILAVHGDEHDGLMAALAAGADRSVPADISCRELVAWLRALLRAGPPVAAAMRPAVAGGPVTVDRSRVAARVAGHIVPLRHDELEVLDHLVARTGRVVRRAALARFLDPERRDADRDRAIDALVRRLREKLDPVDGVRRITTVRGVGFRYDAEPRPAPATR